MNDLLDELHARVALDLLEADSDLTVYEGKVPDTPAARYVLVYTAVEWPRSNDGDALDGRSRTCWTRWYCHCVGGTEASARAIGALVKGDLLNVRPSIAGRTCGLIEQEASPP